MTEVYILVTVMADPAENPESIVSSAHRNLFAMRQEILEAEMDVEAFDLLVKDFKTEAHGIIDGFWVHVRLAEIKTGLSIVETEANEL